LKGKLRNSIEECEACGFSKDLETHHIDWNHENDHPDNLQTLCKYCHMQAHKLGKPEFERMLELVNFNPAYKAELRRSAEEFYKVNTTST